MEQTPRPGSMAEASARENKTFLIVAAIVYFFIILLLIGIPNYLRDEFQRAPWYANLPGILCILGSYWLLYRSKNAVNRAGQGPWQIIGAVVLLVLGICMACGFNFDLFGIADRP